jgi:hypothetical protein
MSYQEKRAVVALLGTILISVFYIMDVVQRYQAENLGLTQLFNFGASAVLIYIPVLVVFNIITHIVFSIIHAIATRKEEPSFADELDKLIDLKATRNFYHTFMVGFLLSIGTQVIDMPPFAMFVGLLFSMTVAGIILGISQLYFYGRGV